jgi:serine phosphatase RsbU (regulator of sigma subunit)
MRSRSVDTASNTPPRWWDTLAVRLAVVINSTAFVVLGVFWLIDFQRERSVHLTLEEHRLREEARVLRAARNYFRGDERFQQYVDTFCHQMDVGVSPGHHIAVFGPDDRTLTRAHVRADPALEARMAATPADAAQRFQFAGEPYLAVGVTDDAGDRIVVTQSLLPVYNIIHDQAASRAVSLAALAVFLSGITTVVLIGWVRSPLRALVTGVRAIAHGRFDSRVPAQGSAELRRVARDVNEMARALERIERRRRAEFNRARDIQRRLLPPLALHTLAYDVTAVFEPAESVGGDLFDAVELPDGSLVVAVLDVSGHGVPGALYTALLRTVLHHHLNHGIDLTALVQAMDREFQSVAGESGEFATCFVVRLDGHSGRADYVSAGHEPAILLRANGSLERLEAGGPPIGVAGGQHVQTRIELSPGDRLYLYTDGLHEVEGMDGLFGRERLAEALRRTRDRSLDDQLAEVVAQVRDFARATRFEDDYTLLCVVRKPESP